MTLHDVAVDWVAKKVRGMITHTGIAGSHFYTIGRMEPDVVQHSKQIPSSHVWHEVEVLHIAKKIRGYKGHANKKILWIILPEGTSKTFQIRLLEQKELDNFKKVIE